MSTIEADLEGFDMNPWLRAWANYRSAVAWSYLWLGCQHVFQYLFWTPHLSLWLYGLDLLSLWSLGWLWMSTSAGKQIWCHLCSQGFNKKHYRIWVTAFPFARAINKVKMGIAGKEQRSPRCLGCMADKIVTSPQSQRTTNRYRVYSKLVSPFPTEHAMWGVLNKGLLPIQNQTTCSRASSLSGPSDTSIQVNLLYQIHCRLPSILVKP